MVCAHFTRSVAVWAALFSGMSVEDMHGSVVVYALSFHMVLSLGHVGLLFTVCAHWIDPRLVKKVGVCVSCVTLVPPVGMIHLQFSCAP